MYGLKDSDLEYITELLKAYSEVDQAILFGSRAMGREKIGSDIDIALIGENLGSIVSQISGKLNDESPMPYFFDILDYALITNQDLIDHIKRVGVVIYTKLI